MSFEPPKKVKDIESDQQALSAIKCAAHGCPNNWTVDAGQSKLCSRHAWADPLDWGAITQEIHAGAFTRINKTQEPVRRLTKDQKIDTLLKLKDVLKAPVDPKEWAVRLRDREMGGDKLTEMQRKAWRAALKHKESHDA